MESENVADVDPAGTVTLEGTLAADVLLDKSATTAPPAGAAPLRPTVACAGVPPDTLVGFIDNADTPGAATVNVAALLLEL
ncbi:MAG TPA: hypothetical protein VI756_07520 [Blastocatellia bacterium]